MEIKTVGGGICAPKGFKAAAVHCGIRNNAARKDLMMIVSDRICDAAAVYTKNKVKGAPIEVTRENLTDGKALAVICNSGNANTCAPGGKELALQTCSMAAKHLKCRHEDIIVASTGIIGEKMSLRPFEKGVPELCENLARKNSLAAAEGIMTTDTVPKEMAVKFMVSGKECFIGGIAKGSGMIHPDMATMLCFITSDADISAEMLHAALKEDVKNSFNQISVDGDTSTNDMVAVMANGTAGNKRISSVNGDYEVFAEALHTVTEELAKKMAADGEGAGKLIEIIVEGAPDKDTARRISRSIVASNLFKAACFGHDANWGRIICAIGYTPGDFSTEKVHISLASNTGEIQVCRSSAACGFDEEKAARILSEKEIKVRVDINQGRAEAKAWGCDLTHDYVTINGDKRT